MDAPTPGKRPLTAGLVQRKAEASTPLEAQIAPAPSGGGRSLDEGVRTKMETSFGADLSAVRVHEGEQAASVGAVAYAQGTDIHFAPGQYDPGSLRGQELLGHEIAHVVQQREGRVAATTQAYGRDVNDDHGLEREADEMGARAARGEPAGTRSTATSGASSVVQRAVIQRAHGDDEAPKPKAESKEKKDERGTVTLPQAVFVSLQPKQFAHDSSANIVEKVKPLLDEYLTSVHYNSLEDAGAFVDHLDTKRKGDKDKETTPQDAFGDFTPDSKASLRKVSGTQCIGQGIHFAQVITANTGYPAHPCAAQFAGKEYYGHAAAMVAFINDKDEADQGFVLLDPGFNVAEPIVVTKAVPGEARKFVYALDESGEIQSKREGKLMVTFPPQEILNPDMAVTKSALLAYDKFRVVARGNNTPVVLELDLRGEMLSVQVKKKKLSVAITDLDAVTKLISEEVAEALGYKPENTELDGTASQRLLATLFKVINARKDVLSLQGSELSGKQRAVELD